MAGQLPSFITGANAKIKVGNLTLAFASDVSYQVTVNHVPVRAMGMLDVAAYEPISYTVSGSFSVIRYTKDAASADLVLYTLGLIDDDDNAETAPVPVEIATVAGKQIPGASTSGNSVHQWNDRTSGNVGRQLDPSTILKSLTFDLEIFSKSSVGDGQESILKIRDCRIASKSGSLSKRGLMIDNFTFNALLANNDESVQVSGTSYNDLRTK